MWDDFMYALAMAGNVIFVLASLAVCVAAVAFIVQSLRQRKEFSQYTWPQRKVLIGLAVALFAIFACSVYIFGAEFVRLWQKS